MLDDSDDEGEVPPLLGPGAASTPSVPSVPSSVPRPAPAAPPPAPRSTPGAPTAPAAVAGAHLKPSNGLKKGFLSGGTTRKQKPVAADDGMSRKQNPTAADSMPTLRANAAAKEKSLQLPELADEAKQAQAAKLGGGNNSWMTPELLQKIAAKPILRKAFTDPRYQSAMTEMQTDPQAAMRKYADVPEIREFLQTFMALMGEHFGELAEKQAAEQGASGAPAPPMLTPEQQKAQDVAQQAMADPEVRDIVADPRIQALLQSMQSGREFEVDAAARSDPEVVGKLRKLAAAGLIGMEFKK